MSWECNKPNIPIYYTFYKPKGVVVSKAEKKFIVFTEVRRKEVHEDNFREQKMGASGE